MVGWRMTPSETGGRLFGVVDVELTNRCNASCTFCPRDLTPHQGVMTQAVFDQVHRRVVEFRDACAPLLGKPLTVSFCGLGEQLLNARVAGFVRDLRTDGLDSVVNTNGALLDERRGRALLDAGVESVVINGGELDDEYEATYHLPFARTRDNVARFVELAGDRCRIFLVLVDHTGDPDHVLGVERYWRGLGITRFFRLDLLNRAGSLPVESMRYTDADRPPRVDEIWRTVAGEAACDAPFQFPFIGYDGQYYLCSSDWQKEVAFGSVFDASIVDTMVAKRQRVISRSPICRTCNHDPLNQLRDMALEVDEGRAAESDLIALAQTLADLEANTTAAFGRLGLPDRPEPAEARRAPALIPVVAR